MRRFFRSLFRAIRFVSFFVGSVLWLMSFFFFVKAGACYAIAEKLADDIKAEYDSA